MKRRNPLFMILMHRSQVLLISAIFFILGVGTRSFWPVEEIIPSTLMVLAISIFCAFYRNSRAMVLALVLFILATGLWRTSSVLSNLDSIKETKKEYSGKSIVTKEPEKKDKYQNIVLLTENNERILIREDLDAVISYGDEFFVNCQLEQVENKDQDFDYRMYLAKDKIYFLCQGAKLEKIGSGKGGWIYGTILNLKNKLQAVVEESLPYPYSALGSGLLFGESGQLPEKLREDFSRTGMTHIVAVSGFNVTIIAQYLILLGIAIGLWRKQAFWFAIAGITLFVAMIGFPSSAVRAGFMGGLILWAMKKGRLADSWNAVALAGAIMLIINPLLLRWDTGFQLSFLATIGLITFSPLWEKISRKKIPGNGVWEIIFLTISAQVFVVPIIAYQFHTFSAVSIAANLLILPIIPLLMLLVFLVAIFGAIWMPLALPISWIAYFFLKYVIETIRFLAGLPFSSFEISQTPILLIAVWYAVWSILAWKIRKNKNFNNPLDLNEKNDPCSEPAARRDSSSLQ